MNTKPTTQREPFLALPSWEQHLLGRGPAFGGAGARRRTWVRLAAVVLLAGSTTLGWAQTVGDYRSKASGNWNSTATWETYSVSAWVAASATPTSSDGAITIQSGHTVTVTVSVTVDQVTVEASGQITVNSGITVTVDDGTGTDLDVFGTMQFNSDGKVSGAGSFRLNSGATLGIGSTDGISSSGASGNVQTTTRTFNAGANYTYNGIAAQVTGNGLPATVNDLTVNNSGPATVTLSGAVAVTGNLTITAGTLDVSASSFGVSVAGNWSNSGTFTPRTGTVTFNGRSGTQTITGTTTFYNLTLSNTGATTDFGSSSVTIANSLNKTAGSILGGTSTVTFTGAGGEIKGSGAKEFNNLVINSGASITASGGSITIKKDFTDSGAFEASAVTTTFDNTGTHNLSGSGTTSFGAVTIQGSPAVVNANSHNFLVASNWSRTSSGVFNGGTATVTFNGAGAQTIAATTFNNLRLSGDGNKTSGSTITVSGNVQINSPAKFNLTYADPNVSTVGSLAFGGTLQAAGTWGSTSSTATHTDDTRFAITTGTGKLNVLSSTAVVLYGFQLGTRNGQVVVRWQTASEVSTLGFRLYRQTGPAAWTQIGGFIPSQGQAQGGVGAAYEVLDPGAQVGETYTYKLVEEETTGGTQEYGPFVRTAQELRLVSPLTFEGGRVVVRWLSRANEVYSVQRCSSLGTGVFVPVATDIAATPPLNSFTGRVDQARGFFRILVQ